jgi:hypothetical protein
MIHYGYDGFGNEAQFLVTADIFIPTPWPSDSGAHVAFYPIGIWDYFPQRHDSHNIKLTNHFCQVLKLKFVALYFPSPYIFSVCSIKAQGKFYVFVKK